MIDLGIDTSDFLKRELDINNNVYYIQLDWTGIFWYIALFESDYQHLIIKTKIVPNYPMVKAFNRYRLQKIDKNINNFNGEIICATNDRSKSNIGQYDFVNGNAKLIYVTGDEINAILATND